MEIPPFVKNLMQRQTVRKFYAPLPESNIADEDFEIRTFEKGKGYFEIRLSEMYLRNRGELFRDFLPMAIVTADFSYAGEHRVVPFVVSADKLANALKAPVKNEYVELRNTKVAGPIPYAGGDVGLFVGLFRTEVNDFSRTLFDFVGNLAQAFDVTQLTGYLKAGEILRDGMRALFGMKQVELCLGTRDEFTDHGLGSARQFRSGYLAFIDAPERQYDADRLWSRGARLYQGDHVGALKEIRDDNYCLVAIDYRGNRSDHANLPFHRLWTETQDMIWNGRSDMADLFGLPALAKAVVQSPDLTSDDKSAAIQLYKANYELEIERFNMIHHPTTKAPATRGRGLGNLDAPAMMQKAAHVARMAGLGEDTERTLALLAKNIGAMRGLPEATERIDLDRAMANQLASLRQTKGLQLPDPAKLAEALAIDAIDTFGGATIR
jgi:hypothetical protein